MNTYEADTFPAATEPDVDPRLLRAFLAVAREGHFGHAAAGLGIAQPALSRQVRRLERLLGTDLLVRTPRGAELTEAGRTVVPEAERALAYNRRLVRAARSLTDAGPAVLTVSAPMPSPPGGLLAEAVRRLWSGRARTRVSVVDLRDGQQAAALADGRVDAVLTWDPPVADGLTGEALVEERTSALLAQGHPRAGTEPMPLAALEAQTVLFPVRERSHCWAQLDAAAAAEGVGITPVPTAPSAVADLVAAGLGVSAVPGSFRFAGYPGVTFVPLERLSGTMSVVWRRDDDSRAVAGFVAACRDAARSLAAAHGDVWRLPEATGPLVRRAATGTEQTPVV
ncbi:LysR family transcriptional regulator [Streptomyces sp. NPDC017673]|uniref:LysR family transcriptional regulator n=1 Tax=unclassified Streptomyces TaxID=2593676 RepID=UPI0037B1A9DA